LTHVALPKQQELQLCFESEFGKTLLKVGEGGGEMRHLIVEKTKTKQIQRK